MSVRHTQQQGMGCLFGGDAVSRKTPEMHAQWTRSAMSTRHRRRLPWFQSQHEEDSGDKCHQEDRWDE